MKLRRFFALLATIGLFASVAAYVASFFGITTGPANDAHPWIMFFFAGAFLTGIPSGIVEYDGERSDPRTYWMRFREQRPAWTVSAIRGAFGLFVGHFALFLVLTHASSPEIVDGQFVLHGSTDTVISQAEYARLMAWETRFFASAFVDLYLVLAVYWWYHPVKRTPGPYGD